MANSFAALRLTPRRKTMQACLLKNGQQPKDVRMPSSGQRCILNLPSLTLPLALHAFLQDSCSLELAWMKLVTRRARRAHPRFKRCPVKISGFRSNLTLPSCGSYHADSIWHLLRSVDDHSWHSRLKDMDPEPDFKARPRPRPSWGTPRCPD